jgi:hypothetical protein
VRTSSTRSSTAISPSRRLLEQEAKALLVRLDEIMPFALQETMTPAAAVSPEALSAIDRYLMDGRRKLHGLVLDYLGWLNDPAGRSAPIETAHQRFRILRLRFNVTLSQFDIFADVLTQRSEHKTGVWLGGLDVLAADALRTPGDYFQAPSLICYLDRGQGAAIRRARTRLPGGGENPVGIIRVPRERMVGSGIASSLIHEVGHQATALLGLIDSIRPVLRGLQRNGGDEGKAWAYWDRCLSEILADFWAVAKVGISASVGLMGVVTLPRYFVFRLNLDDPHPVPWIRVRLSIAIGRELFPHPQWDVLEQTWLAYYPLKDVDHEKREILLSLKKTMPGLATILAHHRPPALRGASLQEALQTENQQPARLEDRFQAWRAQPALLYRASPTMVFAVLGQSLFDGLIGPEEVSRVLSKMLNFWALRDSLNRTNHCGQPSRIKSAAPTLTFAAS